MRPTAMQNCQSFLHAYAPVFASWPNVKVIEVGSQSVNWILRGTCHTNFEEYWRRFSKSKRT